jgi:hypothetical protein
VVYSHQILVAVVDRDLGSVRRAVIGDAVRGPRQRDRSHVGVRVGWENAPHIYRRSGFAPGRWEVFVKHCRQAVGPGGRHQVAEFRRFYGEDRRRTVLAPRAFVAHKEECPVPTDRPSHRGPEEVLYHCCLLVGRVEIIAGVQYTVAQKVVGAAMQRIAARLDHNIRDRSVIAPVFRREIQSLNLKFLDSVNRWCDQGRPAQPFIGCY